MSTPPSTKALPRLVEKLHLKPPALPEALVHQLPRIIEPLASVPPVRRLVSRLLINHFGYATTLRPRALSLASDYTSWKSLTDRTYSGRHLPPADARDDGRAAGGGRRRRAVPARAASSRRPTRA